MYNIRINGPIVQVVRLSYYNFLFLFYYHEQVYSSNLRIQQLSDLLLLVLTRSIQIFSTFTGVARVISAVNPELSSTTIKSTDDHDNE